MRRHRVRLVALAALAAITALGITATMLAGAAPAATSPPFGTDLPNKAFVGNVASDQAKTSSTATGFQVVFLDVGQGDSILVSTGGHRMLIDGGRSATGAMQRLQALGVTDLDAIVATHPDADHIGGLAAVLVAYQVERIYVSGDSSSTDVYAGFLAAAMGELGAQIITVTRGQTVPLGDLNLPVLNPTSATGDANNDSVVLRLTCGSVSVLFTGDAEVPAEQSMLSAGLATHVNVLKVAHHGSNSSSSLVFLQALRPEVAVISAGRTNSYGHPAPETLARLASVGTLFEYTDTTAGDDSVTMTSDCATYSFSTAPTSSTPVPDSTATTTTIATSTPTRTPSPTVTSSAFSLPACYLAGANTCNCSDFTTRSWAQWFHNTIDPADINKLDGNDHDGNVCESLPG